jgi:hypothetical protein
MIRSIRNVALLLVSILALQSAVLTPPQRAQESVPFETRLLGASSGLTRTNYAESEIEVITTDRQWRKAWKRAYPFLETPPPLPEVDFSQRMIIFLRYKYLPDPSFTLAITDLIKHEDHLEIAVRETGRQGQGCPAVPAVIIFPFQIIETEILKKRYRNDIRITAQREIVDCAPRND